MKHFGLLIAFLCLCQLDALAQMAIGENISQKIYINSPASSLQKYTATELQTYLQKIFGLQYAIEENANVPANVLIFASSATVPAFKTPSQTLKNDGFQIFTSDEALVIRSHNERGVLYGVYEFLERYLGCSFLASDAINVPQMKNKQLAAIDTTEVPETGWREVYYYELCDPHIAGMLRLNGNCSTAGLEGSYRYKIRKEVHGGWGSWCHSMWSFLPKTLYTTHPEYFAMVNGTRVAPQNDGTQACTANTVVWDTVRSNLSKVINQPATGLPIWADGVRRYWSVSQMDGNGPCDDPLCKAANSKYGGVRQGSILPMTNYLAEAFPNNKIATLAYNYSRTAPTGIKCDSNVCIQLCSIEPPRSNINEPVATASRHASFRNDLVAWGKICQDITLWFYEIQFQNLIAPFPDFKCMQSDIQYYVKNNTHGMFAQCSREKGGEFAQLRGYVLAKLLWNPYIDMKATETKFFNEYYGAGGVYLKQYFDLMHSELDKSGIALSMDGECSAHKNGYLSLGNINKYKALFDQAEAAVKDDSILLKRVHKERLGIMYAQLRLNYGTVKEQAAVLKDLYHTCVENDVYMLSETDNSYQVGNRDRFNTTQAARLNVDPVTYEYTCVPSGTMHKDGNAYVKSITTSGADKDIIYTCNATPSNVYQVTDTMTAIVGKSFKLAAVANEAGPRSESVVYQDLRYNQCYFYADWVGEQTFTSLGTLGSHFTSSSTLANYDKVMNISHTFNVPSTTKPGILARLRLQYQNAWTASVGPCGAVTEGMIYDIPIKVISESDAITTRVGSMIPKVSVVNGNLMLTASPCRYLVDLYNMGGSHIASADVTVQGTACTVPVNIPHEAFIVKISGNDSTHSIKIVPGQKNP